MKPPIFSATHSFTAGGLSSHFGGGGGGDGGGSSGFGGNGHYPPSNTPAPNDGGYNVPKVRILLFKGLKC